MTAYEPLRPHGRNVGIDERPPAARNEAHDEAEVHDENNEGGEGFGH